MQLDPDERHSLKKTMLHFGGLFSLGYIVCLLLWEIQQMRRAGMNLSAIKRIILCQSRRRAGTNNSKAAAAARARYLKARRAMIRAAHAQRNNAVGSFGGGGLSAGNYGGAIYGSYDGNQNYGNQNAYGSQNVYNKNPSFTNNFPNPHNLHNSAPIPAISMAPAVNPLSLPGSTNVKVLDEGPLSKQLPFLSSASSATGIPTSSSAGLGIDGNTSSSLSAFHNQKYSGGISPFEKSWPRSGHRGILEAFDENFTRISREFHRNFMDF